MHRRMGASPVKYAGLLVSFAKFMTCHPLTLNHRRVGDLW